MFPNEITNTTIMLAVVAAVGGCLVRYATLYKETPHKLRIVYLVMDTFIAAFLGFFTFWITMEELNLSIALGMAVNCVVGFMGAHVFNLGSYLLYKRYGINVKFSPDLESEKRCDCKEHGGNDDHNPTRY